jgi:hypothetical protein
MSRFPAARRRTMIGVEARRGYPRLASSCFAPFLLTRRRHRRSSHGLPSAPSVPASKPLHPTHPPTASLDRQAPAIPPIPHFADELLPGRHPIARMKRRKPTRNPGPHHQQFARAARQMRPRPLSSRRLPIVHRRQHHHNSAQSATGKSCSPLSRTAAKRENGERRRVMDPRARATEAQSAARCLRLRRDRDPLWQLAPQNQVLLFPNRRSW